MGIKRKNAAREIFIQLTPQGILVTSPLFREWGEVEVIQEEGRVILQPKRAAESYPHPRHPAFGLWADLEEDSIQLAKTLRSHIEHRQDVPH